MWSGWVCDISLDTSGPEGSPDNLIDAYDVPDIYDTDNYSVISEAEMLAWLSDMSVLGLATQYDNEWIFNIADIVEQDQTVNNEGAKLLKLRFYPVATTEFIR